jgi:hypothetical protein
VDQTLCLVAVIAVIDLLLQVTTKRFPFDERGWPEDGTLNFTCLGFGKLVPLNVQVNG